MLLHEKYYAVYDETEINLSVIYLSIGSVINVDNVVCAERMLT